MTPHQVAPVVICSSDVIIGGKTGASLDFDGAQKGSGVLKFKTPGHFCAQAVTDERGRCRHAFAMGDTGPAMREHRAAITPP